MKTCFRFFWLATVLFCSVLQAQAWYSSGTIPASDEYHVFDVVRADSDSVRMLWWIAERDTLLYGVTSAGMVTRAMSLPPPEDSLPGRHARQDEEHRLPARWLIYHFHQGCRMDTAAPHTLHTTAFDTLYPAAEHRAFLYYAGRLPHRQVLTTQTRLALQHGITLDESAPYCLSWGDTLWHPLVDAGYYHRVTGIACDTTANLYLSHSTSLEDADVLLTIDSLPHGAWALVGDDDRGDGWRSLPDGRWRTNRTWRLRSSGVNRLLLEVLPEPAQQADTLWLCLMDDAGDVRVSLPADSIGRDGTTYFSLPAAELLNFTLCTNRTETPSPRRNRQQQTINSNGSSLTVAYMQGRLTVTCSGDELPDEYRLSDSAGRLVLLCRPDDNGQASVPVLLPTGLYHVEALKQGYILGSCPVVLH